MTDPAPALDRAAWRFVRLLTIITPPQRHTTMSTTTDKPRRRLSDAERRQRAERAAARWAAALNRAVSGESLLNYATIYDGFMRQGIGEDEIRPRENVFTWGAWKAKGRQPRREERPNAVEVLTYITAWGNVEQADGTMRRCPVGKRATTAKVYHVSQTEPIAA